MAQQQAVKPETIAKTTAKEITATQSLNLMKNLVRASISEICFQRNLFPSDCFKDANFGNTRIRALAPQELAADGSSSIVNEDARRLTVWQEAAFDALDKQYLRCIVFSISSSEEDESKRELLESYVYHIKYPSTDEVELTLGSDKESFALHRLRDEAVTMIRRLLRMTETMKPIPEERSVNLKLFYYDHTPDDYQPPHFYDATQDEHKFYSDAPLKVNIGTVASRNHSMTLKVAFREDMSNDVMDAPSLAAAASSSSSYSGAPSMNNAYAKFSAGVPRTAPVTSSYIDSGSSGQAEGGAAPSDNSTDDTESANAERVAATVRSSRRAPKEDEARSDGAAAAAAADDWAGQSSQQQEQEQQQQQQSLHPLPSSSASRPTLALPDGVDAQVYATAVSLIQNDGVCSLKDMISGQRRSGRDVSTEQARRILRHAAEEGHLLAMKRGGATRYAAVGVSADAQQQKPSSSAVKGSLMRPAFDGAAAAGGGAAASRRQSTGGMNADKQRQQDSRREMVSFAPTSSSAPLPQQQQQQTGRTVNPSSSYSMPSSSTSSSSLYTSAPNPAASSKRKQQSPPRNASSDEEAGEGGENAASPSDSAPATTGSLKKFRNDSFLTGWGSGKKSVWSSAAGAIVRMAAPQRSSSSNSGAIGEITGGGIVTSLTSMGEDPFTFAPW